METPCRRMDAFPSVRDHLFFPAGVIATECPIGAPSSVRKCFLLEDLLRESIYAIRQRFCTCDSTFAVVRRPVGRLPKRKRQDL